MSERIHDDELDTSAATVRRLLIGQCPQWSARPMTAVRASGTTNAMWRLHAEHAPDLVVRLPRQAGADSSDLEPAVLAHLTERPLVGGVRTPPLRHVGDPTDAYPRRWTVLEWLDGTDAWTGRHELDRFPGALALDLARVLADLGERRDVPAPSRRPGQRGGPLEPVLASIERWLERPSATDLVDAAEVRRCAAESAAALDGEDVPVRFVHGDLIPGNLLVAGGRLTGLLDWGGAGYGDPAQDLTPAWAVLDRPSRAAFADAVAADEATWLRARGIALQQAVAGVVYYRPRHHPLGDVMARTLARILDDR